MKNKIKYLLLFIAPIAFSCNSGNDTSSTTPVDTSTTAMKDNTMSTMDTANMNKMDTGMMGIKDMKDTMPMKIVPGKNGKKTKIVIVLPKMDSKAAMSMDADGAYANVDVWPTYPGGQSALERFFSNNVEYPQMAGDNNTEGIVNVNFVIDENGKVWAPKVVGKKVGDGLEEEALRVVNKMPAWTPGKVKGKNVKTRFTLPVRFQLES